MHCNSTPDWEFSKLILKLLWNSRNVAKVVLWKTDGGEGGGCCGHQDLQNYNDKYS